MRDYRSRHRVVLKCSTHSGRCWQQQQQQHVVNGTEKKWKRELLVDLDNFSELFFLQSHFSVMFVIACAVVCVWLQHIFNPDAAKYDSISFKMRLPASSVLQPQFWTWRAQICNNTVSATFGLTFTIKACWQTGVTTWLNSMWQKRETTHVVSQFSIWRPITSQRQAKAYYPSWPHISQDSFRAQKIIKKERKWRHRVA